jgi:hypothetical protein
VGFKFDPRPIARRIWSQVGYEPIFPRDLTRPILEAFDLAIVLLPTLSIPKVNYWLSERGRATIGGKGDRPLRACLLGRKGKGLMFVDGGLPQDERQFAIGHEVAHFVAHYLEPRRRAIAHFGAGIASVVDGERVATTAERMSALLHGVPIGPFEDFLSRDGIGRPSATVLDRETEADMIAAELLAPLQEVLNRVDDDEDFPALLASGFGLPHWAAAEWATFVSNMRLRADPFVNEIERTIKKNG